MFSRTEPQPSSPKQLSEHPQAASQAALSRPARSLPSSPQQRSRFSQSSSFKAVPSKHSEKPQAAHRHCCGAVGTKQVWRLSVKRAGLQAVLSSTKSRIAPPVRQPHARASPIVPCLVPFEPQQGGKDERHTDTSRGSPVLGLQLKLHRDCAQGRAHC